MHQRLSPSLSVWLRRAGLALLMALGLVTGGALTARLAHAQMATMTSITTCDEATLDAAIANAASGDTLSFGCSGDIKLTQTLNISKNLTLDGSGQSVTLDGNNSVGVLSVNGGVNLSLNGLTVANGSASDGSGILNSGGTVTITNSTVINNTVTRASGGGGGIYNNGGTVTITNSTFTGNSANGPGAGGGGILNGGTMTITNSTFTGNSSHQGGGIDNKYGDTVTITNSTIANNSASTIGGILTFSGMANLIGSIVANNTGGNCYNFGPVTDDGYNLSDDSSCGLTASTSQQNVNPQLASALANNGGPTQTLALLAGSPAIDGIPAAQCPSTDQRGMTRPDNGESTCDIGAYEFVDPDTDLALTNVPANITTSATSAQGAVVTYTAPTATDEGGETPTVSCTPTSGSTFAVGTTKVTCTATDSDDTPSTVSASFTVTVTPLDNDLALTNVPANMTANATSAAGAVVTYTALTATDEGGETPAVTCTPTSGSTFAIGTTTVTCTATDSDDTPSTVSASFTITVVDKLPPSLQLPASPMTVDATSPQGATVNYRVTASDPVYPADQLTLTCTPASGSTFAIGSTTVTCSVSDPAGNSATGSFQVVVNGAATQVNETIALVNSFQLSGGIQNSFDSQLQAVQVDLQATNTAQACSDLTSFINHVKAQSGKQLTANQANQLLAAAKRIQAVIGC